jgi:hypothetical protein
MRVGLRGTVRRVRGRRGVKVRQRLQLRYEWRYLFLAVDSRAGKLYWCWLDSMAADEAMAAVGGIQEAGVVSALVWDGAPGHRDEDVVGLGLPLVGLPPYSPELNPAERVFEELRRVTEGKVYATLDEKVAAVEERLRELKADPECVRSLADWGWIQDAVNCLPPPHAA